MKPLSNALRISAKRIAWFVLLLLLSAAPGLAANLAVTSAADGGFGSLRATIASANSGDTILFAGSLAGQTIHLTSGELTIGVNLTIDGSALPIGAKQVAIDGGGNSRVFEITAGNVTLDSIIITNGSCPAGDSGGGILVDSGAALSGNSLTISGCFATNASVGGGISVSVSASVSLVSSTISGCIATNVGSAGGGGIYSAGTVVLDHCALSGNTAGYGGGIYNFNNSTLILNDCTFAGNSASGYGGGFYCYNLGTFTLVNCTLSGNSATFGGGIFDYHASVLTNTIVAGNTASAAGPDISGPYSGANNFVGGDPKLAPLGNYGGPTQTMEPLYGSPVIDAGSDSVLSFLTTDQRGYPRLSGAQVDIGAVEAQIAPANNRPVLKNVTQSGNEFQFAFTNAPNLEFTALTATNLTQPFTNWTALGSVTEISSGQYQFTDASATNKAHQFYRVVSP